MSSWTPELSVLLSTLLDDVVGTHQYVAIRQDRCKLLDCIETAEMGHGVHIYLTGSKSEGLDLHGSDTDLMREMNEEHRLEVIQQGQTVSQTHKIHFFMMVTDNVHPAFAMLKIISDSAMPCLFYSLQVIDGSHFLSSYLTVYNHFNVCGHNNLKMQGPSIEHTDFNQDHVYCVRCLFWPSSASEWITRNRSSNWPSVDTVKKIVDFGFHLVPVGYPGSVQRLMEWRISFSVAERLLVWSFNHIQIQMYAIMKIILKEFVKVNCSPENYVLCSYFIKTFLFWKFEETDQCFWVVENFRECLKFLLTEFHRSLQRGCLKHYFIPCYNLLEVKFTQHARAELLQIYDMALQYDVKIIEQCSSLKTVWETFSNRTNNQSSPNQGIQPGDYFDRFSSKYYFLMDSFRVMLYMRDVHKKFHEQSISKLEALMKAFNAYTEENKTSFAKIYIRRYRLLYNRYVNRKLPETNKSISKFLRFSKNCSMDIATDKLWAAIVFLLKGDYSTTLLTINKLLSSIPPCALYIRHNMVSTDGHVLYADTFANTDLIKIARKAWLFNFNVPDYAMSLFPTAIHSMYLSVEISPLVFAYYLQFLCYHGLRQYENRGNALRQLVEVVDNPEQNGCECIRSLSYEIAGHCLLCVGESIRATQMFNKASELKIIRNLVACDSDETI